MQPGVSDVGTRVPVVCNSGYQLIGLQYIECAPNGQWSPAPQCIGNIISTPAPGVSTTPGGPTCGLPPLVANAIPQPGPVANSYTYNCAPGFEYAGPLLVSCVEGRFVQESDPQCVPVPDSRCRAGPTVPTRSEPILSVPPNNDMVACPQLRVACTGEVDKIIFLSNRDDGAEVMIDIWRRLMTNRYELVTAYRWNATQTGRVVLELAPDQRVPVQPDDFIGIHYSEPGSTAVIPWADEVNSGPFQSSDLYDCYVQPQYDDDIQLALQTQGWFPLGSDVRRRIPAVQLTVKCKLIIHLKKTCKLELKSSFFLFKTFSHR